MHPAWYAVDLYSTINLYSIEKQLQKLGRLLTFLTGKKLPRFMNF